MVADEHRVDVAFGRGSVSVYADPELADWEVIRPAFEAVLPDPKRHFMHAIDEPVECEPLHEIVSPGDRVVIVTSDGTRAVPNRQLIPWIVEALPVPKQTSRCCWETERIGQIRMKKSPECSALKLPAG